MTSERALEMQRQYGKIGRPFEKGKSGNPSGKPKGDPKVKELFKARSLEAAEKLVELLNSDNEKIVFMVAQEILNRTEGKPNQAVSMEVNGELDVNSLRTQVRAVLLESLNAGRELESEREVEARRELESGD